MVEINPDTQARLNAHLMKWNTEIRAFDQALSDYGRNKADLEHRRAVIRAHARAEDPKITGTRLDDIVDADPDVYHLHLGYRTTEANVEATRARLRWFSAVADALRTQISTERQERQLYADHGARGT